MMHRFSVMHPVATSLMSHAQSWCLMANMVVWTLDSFPSLGDPHRNGNIDWAVSSSL